MDCQRKRLWFCLPDFRATLGILTCLLLAASVRPVAAQSPSSEIFPDSAVFYVSVPDARALSESFEATDLGKLFEEPALQPFLKDLRAQLENKFADEIQRNGLTLEDLKEVKSGEVAFATILFEDGTTVRAGSAFLIHVGDDLEQGKKLQDQIEDNLQKREAKQMPDVEFGEVKVKYYEPKRDGGEIRRPRVYFVHRGDWVVVSNQQPIMESLLESISAGRADKPLAMDAHYRLVRERLEGTNAPAAPQLTWYAAPFPLANAIRNQQVTPGRASRYLQAMEQTGFDVIKGVGGDFAFNVAGDEYFFQTFIAVPGEGSLASRLTESSRLLAFSPPADAGGLDPGKWVRDSAASAMTWYWDSGVAFSAVEPLVDQLYDEGTFRRVINDIRNAESTKVDLQQLAESLGPRWTLSSEIVPPMSGTSEKMLLAIETKDAEVALPNLRNYLKADWYTQKEIEGQPALEFWEFEGEPMDEPGPLEILNNPGGDEDGIEEDEEDGLLLGMSAFAFPPGENVILASNDPQYLVQVMESKRGLAELPIYEELRAKLASYLQGPPSFYRMAMPARIHELSYHLLREGKLPASETRLEQTLRSLLGTEKGVIRQQEIDGSKMPEDFAQTVAPYLGPTGWLLGVEDGGWIIVGAGLKND